jgi:hypothetical protein
MLLISVKVRRSNTRADPKPDPTREWILSLNANTGMILNDISTVLVNYVPVNNVPEV